MTTIDADKVHGCRDRARKQIEMGETFAREHGAPRNEAVDAMHFMIDDGGAARQGDDPSVLLHAESPAIRGLYPRAIGIERKRAQSWTEAEAADVFAHLDMLGPTRAEDILRLRAHGAT